MTEDKINRMIEKWTKYKSRANFHRQEAVMAGATRKEISAMDAYITTYDKIIKDLYSLK